MFEGKSNWAGSLLLGMTGLLALTGCGTGPSWSTGTVQGDFPERPAATQKDSPHEPWVQVGKSGRIFLFEVDGFAKHLDNFLEERGKVPVDIEALTKTDKYGFAEDAFTVTRPYAYLVTLNPAE